MHRHGRGLCGCAPDGRRELPVVEEARGVGGDLQPCADLFSRLVSISIGGYWGCKDVDVLTSASSLACSMTCTAWPDAAQEIAAAMPLRPAPTMVMFKRASSGICVGVSWCRAARDVDRGLVRTISDHWDWGVCYTR